MLSRATSSLFLLPLSLSLIACEPAATDGELPPGTVVLASDYLPPPAVLDVFPGRRLQRLQEEAGSPAGLDRANWNSSIFLVSRGLQEILDAPLPPQTRGQDTSFIQEQVDGPLSEFLELPSSILEESQEIELVVQEDGTLLGSVEVELLGQLLDVGIALRPDVNGEILDTQLFINDQKRVEVVNDFDLTEANAVFLNGDGEPAVNLDFRRDGEEADAKLLFLNKNNSLNFASRPAFLFFSFDRGDDGFDQNFEFEFRLNPDNFAGRLTAKILFKFNICFGNGNLSFIRCRDLREQEPELFEENYDPTLPEDEVEIDVAAAEEEEAE